MSDLMKALAWKYGDGCASVSGEKIVVWNHATLPQPSASEVSVAVSEWQAESDVIAWEKEMEASDALIPRWAEDLYDALPADQKAAVAQETVDKIAAKKALRGQKP